LDKCCRATILVLGAALLAAICAPFGGFDATRAWGAKTLPPLFLVLSDLALGTLGTLGRSVIAGELARGAVHAASLGCFELTLLANRLFTGAICLGSLAR